MSSQINPKTEFKSHLKRNCNNSAIQEWGRERRERVEWEGYPPPPSSPMSLLYLNKFKHTDDIYRFRNIFRQNNKQFDRSGQVSDDALKEQSARAAQHSTRDIVSPDFAAVTNRLSAPCLLVLLRMPIAHSRNFPVVVVVVVGPRTASIHCSSTLC